MPYVIATRPRVEADLTSITKNQRETELEKINLKKRIEFSARFSPRILRAADKYKVPLILMKPGQGIPPHPSGAGVFYIISGSGVMTVDGDEAPVGEGDMIFVENGAERGIRATSELVAFAVHIS